MDAVILRDSDGSHVVDVYDHLVVQNGTELFYHVCCDCGNLHRVWIDWLYPSDHRAKWEIPDLETVPPHVVETAKAKRKQMLEYAAQLACEGKTMDEIVELTLNAPPACPSDT